MAGAPPARRGDAPPLPVCGKRRMRCVRCSRRSGRSRRRQPDRDFRKPADAGVEEERPSGGLQGGCLSTPSMRRAPSPPRTSKLAGARPRYATSFRPLSAAERFGPIAGWAGRGEMLAVAPARMSAAPAGKSKSGEVGVWRVGAGKKAAALVRMGSAEEGASCGVSPRAVRGLTPWKKRGSVPAFHLCPGIPPVSRGRRSECCLRD